MEGQVTTASPEVEELKDDLEAMRHEIDELKAMAKPFLAGTAKTNSSVKWTWADPPDDSAGPGSYNISTELGKLTHLSTMENSPRPVMPRARTQAVLGLVTPAGSDYRPKLEAVKRTDPKYTFGRTDAHRLRYLDELKSRSPGPVYFHEFPRQSGGRISSTKRDTYAHFIRNDFPSPQHYVFPVASARPFGRFDKGKKDDYMKEYIPGMDRLLKGREGCFPATDTRPIAASSVGLLKCSGHQTLLHHSVSNPGVGAYSVETVPTQRCKFSFPKATRRIDLRQK